MRQRCQVSESRIYGCFESWLAANLIKKHHLAQKRSNGAAAPVPPARRDAISALRTRPQEASSCDDPAFGEFAKRCRLIQWRRERLEEPLELGAPEIDVCNERDRKSTRLNSSH